MTTNSKTISNVSEKILLALSKYKFLTVSQMLNKVGVGTSSISYLRTNLRNLKNDRKRPLIGVIEYAPSGPSRGGRYEYFYYLKNYGKKLLVEQLGVEEQSVKIPIGVPQFHSMYHHRRMQIDFQIALYKYVESQEEEVLFYDNDYDTIGGNRSEGHKLEAKTKIIIEPRPEGALYIIPDGAFVLSTKIGEKLFLTEFHRGSGVKRAVKQLYFHGLAIAKSLPSKKYNFPKGNRTLMIFEHKVTMHSVVRELEGSHIFAGLHNNLLFKTKDQIMNNDFGSDWLKFTGELVALY